MECTDSRRMTGPNLHLSTPGVVAEIVFGPEEDPNLFVAAWKSAVQTVMNRFKLGEERIFDLLHARYPSGQLRRR